MEIEVGEYIRSKIGYIAKIIEIDTTYIYCDDVINNYGSTLIQINEDREYGDTYKDIIKNHDKDIINLIEEGDYVNGRKVKRVFVDPFTKKTRLEIEGTEINWQGDMSSVYCESDEIKSIVTKEQFADEEYRVEG